MSFDFRPSVWSHLLLALAAASALRAAALVERPRVVVVDVPPVQVLVPGFSVRELPVQLRNLNNLVYAPDGRLFALGYDGYVWLLKDTDADGLEDAATAFHDNAKGEIPPSIGMAWGPGGLYIASRGRVIHLRDKGDGTSELVTVTSGWLPPTAAAGSNLDAVGLAVDAQGNIYFGLGCDAWNGAYRINKQTGVSDYHLYSERGTILRLSPDWKRRDIISTGLRFPVSLAFNAAGDLFCSDQEGATWLPNGNPFDELLHIERGRHFGFPPRHPQHLPGVIDEPSVFDYGPQHQSTCGVHFNEPVGGGNAIFGPDSWRGDAFVAGESRGKIWRTKLVKTAAGYVAKNDLIACVSMLAIDAVPTPRGDLLVACHSGNPDWGTGPRGAGKIFVLSYRDREAPQPVLAYAASPTETRVVFDRPVEAARWRTLARDAQVTMGAHVAAGDRFEKLVPPYQVVKDQAKVARFAVPVVSAGLAADRRSVVLHTAARTEATHYAVALPDGTEGLETPRRSGGAPAELPQHAAIDLLTDLSGVEAEWRDAGGAVKWRGWLPHLDLQVARELTVASAEHRDLFTMMRAPGRLTLRTQLDLHLMLRTAIQPGSKIDFAYPREQVTLRLQGAVAGVGATRGARAERIPPRETQLRVESAENEWPLVTVAIDTTAEDGAALAVTWHTAEDARARALPLRRMLLPWATPKTATPAASPVRSIPEIAGGDWKRGREVFFGQTAACSACHQVGGEGGVIGPELTNLVHRDYGSVLRDIVEPSATINPDRIAYIVELKDGSAATGMLVEDNAQRLVLADAAGGRRAVDKLQVSAIKASPVSLMPGGLWEALSAQQQRDLMTFLLTEAPR
jgi:putative heme-binding domain-containing protein